MSGFELRDCITDLEIRYGSLRAVARAIDCDSGYLSRLKYGQKTNPSKSTLDKLGLEKIIEVHYVRK